MLVEADLPGWSRRRIDYLYCHENSRRSDLDQQKAVKRDENDAASHER
jgi:hypothetical protein